MKKSVLEALLVVVLLLFSIYMWSLPIKTNPLPYGEVDAAHHFGIADYMSQSDRIEDLYKAPFMFYGYSHRGYGGKNITTESPYAPHFFINEAIAQIFTGDRFVSYYLLLSILCTSVILSSYLFIRKLFGIIPALLACLLIATSKIDILTFEMGQYVVLVSYACLPLILYCYYKYTNSVLEAKAKPIYLYVMAFLIVTQFFNHYQSLIDTFLILAIFSILLWIKEKKIFFNIKHITIFVIIFFLLTGPFLYKSIAAFGETSSIKAEDISTNWLDIFSWYSEGYSKISVGQSMFSYSAMHGLWTLPFLLIGIIFLLIRRERKDIMILSWLFALYLILHFDLFFGWSASRLLRDVNNVPYMFYSLIGIGAVGIAAIIPIKANIRKILTYVIAGVFIIIFISTNFASSYTMLNQAYTSPYRMNSAQYNAAIWMDKNTKEGAFFFDKGTLVQATKRFIRAVSHRYMLENDDELDWLRSIHTDDNLNIDYYFVDYSELTIFGMKKEADALLQWEKENLANYTILYNKENIRIYGTGKN